MWGFHCLGLEGLVTVPSLQYVRGSHNVIYIEVQLKGSSKLLAFQNIIIFLAHQDLEKEDEKNNSSRMGGG